MFLKERFRVCVQACCPSAMLSVWVHMLILWVHMHVWVWTCIVWVSSCVSVYFVFVRRMLLVWWQAWFLSVWLHRVTQVVMRLVAESVKLHYCFQSASVIVTVLLPLTPSSIRLHCLCSVMADTGLDHACHFLRQWISISDILHCYSCDPGITAVEFGNLGG